MWLFATDKVNEATTPPNYNKSKLPLLGSGNELTKPFKLFSRKDEQKVIF